jgi:hypothetical protein
MAGVGVVGNLRKKLAAVEIGSLIVGNAPSAHQVMGHRPRNSLTSPNKWGRTERPPSLGHSMLIGEQHQIIMAIVSRT